MVAKEKSPNPGPQVPELRRGALVIAILSRLRRERYGYALREELATSGLEINEGTLYPLLRRLEGQSLLESRWQLGENRPRRYYQTSAAGKAALKELVGEWRSLVEAMDALLAEE